MANLALQDLRRELREKFPGAHAPVLWHGADDAPAARPFDPAFFPAGGISEAIGSGVNLLVAGLLGEPGETTGLPEFVLVDGGDAFDPASFSATACSRLVWVRCSSPEEMLKATDLLVRDGNIPFILLDTCGIPARALRAIPASSWWRLKIAAEASGCRLVVLSAFTQVPCAAVRVVLDSRLGMADFATPRRELLQRLRMTPERLKRLR